MFTQKSPKNNRPDIDDVVAIITDGNPWGVVDILNKTMKNANLIKEKGIVIVGAAVGSEEMRAKFRPNLEAMATSPGHVVQADYKNINTIRSRLIENTCLKPASKATTCLVLHLKILYITIYIMTVHVFYNLLPKH